MHVPTFFNVIVSVTLKATLLLALGWAVGLLLKEQNGLALDSISATVVILSGAPRNNYS